MKTQVTKILRDVEIALNEVNPNEAAFVGDTDHADLLTIIENQIEATVDQVHSKARIGRMALDATEEICYQGDTTDPRFIYNNRTGVLTILVRSFSSPSDTTFNADMLRLVRANAKGWPFDVTNEIFDDDPLFAIVCDSYVGAQVDFPAVTRRKRNISVDNKRKSMEVLELRCLERPSDWATVSYIPRAHIHDGQVDIDSALYHEFIDALVAKVMTIRNN